MATNGGEGPAPFRDLIITSLRRQSVPEEASNVKSLDGEFLPNNPGSTDTWHKITIGRVHGYRRDFKMTTSPQESARI